MRIKDNQFDTLGLRLDTVRHLLNTKTLTPWARIYWKQVLLQLERRWERNAQADKESVFDTQPVVFYKDDRQSSLAREDYER